MKVTLRRKMYHLKMVWKFNHEIHRIHSKTIPFQQQPTFKHSFALTLEFGKQSIRYYGFQKKMSLEIIESFFKIPFFASSIEQWFDNSIPWIAPNRKIKNIFWNLTTLRRCFTELIERNICPILIGQLFVEFVFYGQFEPAVFRRFHSRLLGSAIKILFK